MSLIDIKDLMSEARAEVNKEAQAKAKTALVAKLRQLAAAEQVVRNINAEIEDLKASIVDGSFRG